MCWVIGGGRDPDHRRCPPTAPEAAVLAARWQDTTQCLDLICSLHSTTSSPTPTMQYSPRTKNWTQRSVYIERTPLPLSALNTSITAPKPRLARKKED